MIESVVSAAQEPTERLADLRAVHVRDEVQVWSAVGERCERRGTIAGPRSADGGATPAAELLPCSAPFSHSQA